MTQGVVSMSARQVAPRKNTSKTLFMVSAASSLANLIPEEGQTAVTPEHAHNNKRISPKSQVGDDFFSTLTKRERKKVRTARNFLKSVRGVEAREVRRTVNFASRRMPELVQAFNAQLEMLTTGDMAVKKFLVDKKRATKIHAALLEARSNIVKQEQPLLTKMTTFDWASHAEIWDKELQDVIKKNDTTTNALTPAATPYAFGQPNLFNNVVTPLTTEDDAWQRAVANFQRVLDGPAKQNVEAMERSVANLSRDDKKKFRPVSEAAFTKITSQIMRRARQGQISKRRFMKWINTLVVHDKQGKREMNQFFATVGTLNAYLKTLDPTNPHVINAMNKAEVHELVYKNVLQIMAKEMESKLRSESVILQGLTKTNISNAVTRGDDTFTKLVYAVNTTATHASPKKFQNTIENAILSDAQTFYQNWKDGKYVVKDLKSLLDAEEGQNRPQPMSNKELAQELFLGAAMYHEKALQRDAEQANDSQDSGFESSFSSLN